MKMSRMLRGECGNESTPICRCRVLYMGSAVPHITKDGLQGIQEPLRELYPEQGAVGARGIDSWLSVWSNGLLLENVDENHKKVTRFFPIESLHYCAAVRYVLVPEKASNNPSIPRFLPLDSPFARTPNPNHPPLFAAILRRTTGIKVLECHAFICKREMAANALVRCCFHAYADSSYAKQIDEKSNDYDTFRPDIDAIDRVEGWRQNTSKSAVAATGTGSTLTLNGHTGTLRSVDQMTIGDDMSVYNGDENHKVWAGMSLTENIYGNDYDNNYNASTIRSGKTSRPRQAMPPAPPPPPPVKDEKKKTKTELDKKKKRMGSREDMALAGNDAPIRHSQSVNNVNTRGHVVGSGGGGSGMRLPIPPIYTNGTLIRPAPHPIIYMPATATLPHPSTKKRIQHHAGTFSHRPRPHIIGMPSAGVIGMPSKGKNKGKTMPIYTMEEPIYLPSARPLSPVASYQPGQFPHEAYLLQQYATMDTGKKKKKGKNKKNMSMAVPIQWANGQSVYPSIYQHPPSVPPLDIPLSPIHNGDGDGDREGEAASPDEEDQDSPFNTGIYRKKGHLNERAFSYSIRQEHRSRSYGSLANLKFATPVANGAAIASQGAGAAAKPDVKKEREIMQMMHDLDLSGDELERSEVPRAVYESKRLAAVHSNSKLHR